MISLPWRKEASTKETSKDPLHDLVTDCDWLAAGPTDSQRPKSVPGVDFKQINIGSAVVACREAVNKYPDVARFSFQLGRVLDVSKDYLEARKQYEIAAKLGNATALNNIGLFTRMEKACRKTTRRRNAGTKKLLTLAYPTQCSTSVLFTTMEKACSKTTRRRNAGTKKLLRPAYLMQCS
jgi:hypothetical protein